MQKQVHIRPPADEEVISVLNAISIVSSRLARKLQATALRKPRPSKPMICPLRQERMKPHETVRG